MISPPGPDPPVNSRVYWDGRFRSDWDAKGGREQSRIFMDVLVKFLPAAIYEEISTGGLSILDGGCAKGDGTAVLAREFPRSAVSGCDFSATAIAQARASYPDVEFFVSDFADLARKADVVVSSNCFEHLERPLSALRNLLGLSRRYLLLLVPFLETYPLHEEHLRVVHTATFPERLAEGHLVHRILVPPIPPWSGHQILLIYSHEPEAASAHPSANLGDDDRRLQLEVALGNLGERLERLPAMLERLPEHLESLARRHTAAVGALAREVEGIRSTAEEGREALRSLEARLEGRERKEISALDGELADLQLVAERRRLSIQDFERTLCWNRQALAATRREVEEAAVLVARWQSAGERVAEERALALARSRDFSERFAALESALAVRLVFRFWRLLDHLAPPGTRRRILYERLLRPVRRRPATAPSAAPAPEPIPLAILPDPPSSDFLADLRLFETLIDETGAERVVTIFSGTSLQEDEGQRPTQLALELSRRGVPVLFAYWRWSRNEQRRQDRWDQAILQIPLDLFVERPELLATAFRRCRRVALFEFPYPGFFELIAACNGAGWISVYDVLDDWAEFHREGQASWYEAGFEHHLINAVDAVFAVTSVLAERVVRLGGSRVEVLPNGIRPGIEEIYKPLPLERGDLTVGYFGHLTEAWFDWDLVVGAARLRPTWRFYLIGYGQSMEASILPGNLALLGKRPQRELSAYAANWDVAVVPFKAGPLAAGADPIKIYEYLAMGLPVVVTGVFPPPGAEAFVSRAGTLEEFVRALEREASRRSEGEEERRAYAASCTWGHRVETLLARLGDGAQRVREKQRMLGG